MEVTTYSAVCRRAGRWWAISVPGLKGVHTQVRRLDQVAAMTREAIALLLDVRPETVQVDVVPELPDSAARALDARRIARDADRAAEQATVAAVRDLLNEGYTAAPCSPPVTPNEQQQR